MDKLIEAGRLLAKRAAGALLSAQLALQGAGDLPQHPQWFIRMDQPLDDAAHGGRTLRETRPQAIEADDQVLSPTPAATASAPWSRVAPTG
jgi:isoleucyl-tRNA synthetase